ncbi:MAG: hypothetical protein M0R46_07415 [Candidatus Muirbacterium halophilum]|nr:hypothetical protein [Candidatus Muirbacterium halophilum]MCK9475728.1 hypothetical protein [Candidatus Muirbacterium halophilum]
MLGEKKVSKDEKIYSFADKIEEIVVLDKVLIKDNEGQEFILNFPFPIGLIEKKLGMSCRVEYIALQEEKVKVIDIDDKNFEHFYKSYEKFNRIKDDRYLNFVYFQELCFVKETRKYLFNIISKDNIIEDKESYFEDAMKSYTLDKYTEYLDNIIGIFSYYNISEHYNKKAKFNQAKAFFEIGQCKKAVDILKELTTDADYADSETYDLLGKCYFKIGQLKQAIEYSARAVEYNQNYYQAFHNLAVYYIKINDIPNAADCWKQVLKINKEHKKAKNNLAIIKKNVG